MPFDLSDPDAARRARCRLNGLHRAAFWRALGFPNLKRATEAHKANAAKRRAEKERLALQPWARRKVGRLLPLDGI
jgi:hypothetical protein